MVRCVVADENFLNYMINLIKPDTCTVGLILGQVCIIFLNNVLTYVNWLLINCFSPQTQKIMLFILQERLLILAMELNQKIIKFK